MSETVNLSELQKELLKIAEKEARKAPNIRKNKLKKNIREQVFPSDTIRKILPASAARTIDRAIDAVTEMAITMARLRVEARSEVTGKPGRPHKKERKKAKKKGKSMAETVADLYAKKKTKTMKVTDIKAELLKRRGYKGREKQLYTTITVALNQSRMFQKVGKGEYRLVGTPGAKKKRKKAGKKKVGKKAAKKPAKKKAAKKIPAKKKVAKKLNAKKKTAKKASKKTAKKKPTATGMAKPVQMDEVKGTVGEG